MYKKKSRTPVIIAVVAVVILIAAMVGLQVYSSRRSEENAEVETETEKETEVQTETETPTHEILLYKNSAGEVSFDETWVVSDADDEAVLAVEENTLVTMMVMPDEGKQLDSVDVLDYDMHTISSVLRSASGTEGDTTREMRLSFVMPDCDIFISFNFTDIEEELEEAAAEEPDDPTYGLVLHNVSEDVITSFNGQFDEEKFLSALGEALHVDSSRSEYRTVTDVYFGNLVENSTEKLSYEIYFNNDMLWKVLATYYPSEDSYVFTEIVDETDAVSAAETSGLDSSSGTASGSAGTTTYGSTGTTGSYGSDTTGTTDSSSTTETTSFDIMSVSTVFLQFCGSEDAFYQAAFDYVLNKGLTGNIVGTMSDYEIDPDAQTATIHIMLNTGGSMTGTYNKKNNTYSFSGL